MMLFGVFWAAFAPLLLLAAWAGLAWLLRRLAPARFGWRGALLLAAIVLGAPLGWIWRQDSAAFQAVCRAEGATNIREKAQADGILLTSGTSNSFGMRYLHSEGFAWMESNDIYKRGGFVRYARNDKGEITTTKIDAPTARYEVREIFERQPNVGISRTLVLERESGRELARGSSLSFDGGRLKWVFGAWGVGQCPNARTDPAAFNAWYHLAKNTLR